MPELTIKYKTKKTLEALIDFSKYFGFSIISTDKPQKARKTKVNGVTVVHGDSSIDISELGTIFTNRKIDAKQLRKTAWQRNR